MKLQVKQPIINKLTAKYVLTILSIIILSSLQLNAQVNFSGVWMQDNEKSDDFYKNFNITRTIKQTDKEISIASDFFSKEGEKITTMSESFNLDGKETSVEEEGGINRKSAKWSADKKTLTITNTRTVGTEVYGSHIAYTLSGNGKVLTTVTTDANPLTGLKVTQIFNKK
jgi:hypothetical protein